MSIISHFVGNVFVWCYERIQKRSLTAWRTELNVFPSLHVYLYVCSCTTESIVIFGLSGIMSADTLRRKWNTKSFSYLSWTHSGMPLFLRPLLSTHSLIISKVNVLYCDIVFLSSSQSTTFEKLTDSIVPPVPLCLYLLFFWPLLSVSSPPCYPLMWRWTSCPVTLCIWASPTIEKWIGNISTSWRTRGAQQLHKKGCGVLCSVLHWKQLILQPHFWLEHCASKKRNTSKLKCHFDNLVKNPAK